METIKKWWNTEPTVLHMHFLQAIDEPEITEYIQNSDNIHRDSITNDRKGTIFDERYVNSRTCPLWYLCNSQLPTRASLKYVIRVDKGNEVRGFAAHKTFTDVVYKTIHTLSLILHGTTGTHTEIMRGTLFRIQY